MRQKIFALMILMLFVLGLAACGETPQEVKVERLINIDYKGIDGYAEPVLSLDEDYILSLIDPDGDLDDLGEIEVLKGREKEKFTRRLKFFDTLTYRFDEPYARVKNGDGLTVIVSQNEEASEDSKFYLDRREFDHKVTGLPEGEPVDFSQAYILETKGFDGEGTATLNESTKFKKDLNLPFELELSKDQKLSNDDTVTVKVIYDPDTFGEAGYVVKEATLEHTIAGLMPLTLLDADALWQGIKIDFQGFAPYLTPDLKNSLPETYRDFFELTIEDEQERYALGDTLKLKLKLDPERLDELKAVGYDCEEDCFKKEIELTKDNVNYYLEDIADLDLKELKLEDIRGDDGEILVEADTVPDQAHWLVLTPAENAEDTPLVPHNVLLLVYELKDQNLLAIVELSGIVSGDGEVRDLNTRSVELLSDVKTKRAVKQVIERLQDKGDYDVTDVTDVTDDLYPKAED